MRADYHKDYNLRRYHERRQEFIALLGGRCNDCGSIDQLEFDHIDPDTKTMNIGRMLNVSKDKALEELQLCQLLCKTCHIKKSRRESSVGHGEGATGKRNCRCALCGPLKNAYAKRYR